MQKNRTIICFTASYPYGKRETYFETELQYLAKAFDRVIIVPKYNPYKVDGDRKMPTNVEAVSPALSMNKMKRFIKGVFSSAPIGFYFEDSRENTPYRSLQHFKSWFQSLLMHRITYRKFTDLLRGVEGEVVVYSYWADAPVIATQLLQKYRKVVRMHRWDFYVEEDRKSTRLNSSHVKISYAVFCLKKKK